MVGGHALGPVLLSHTGFRRFRSLVPVPKLHHNPPDNVVKTGTQATAGEHSKKTIVVKERPRRPKT
jgi:hypothetical protein